VKRILIWSPNYAPEPTGIPPLVTDAAEWLVARGHSVDVVTAVPNYPERRIHPEYRGVLSRSETLNGVRVHRSWLRARPERSFADKALYELTISTFALPHAVRLARRADVVVCVVPTLLAAAYAAGVTRVLNKRLVLWVQDLVLSAAASVGLGAGASRILSVAGRF
jgi:colanic acid biosynthesis glycosyl transferase WcaI